MTRKPSYLHFDKEKYAWSADINYKKKPEKYRVGKGEQGVLICEPYKSAIGPVWKFRTPEVARVSAERILNLFRQYLDSEDFVGADLARKYLQMGFTRSRRYANYQGGNKYDKTNSYTLRSSGTGEPMKAESAKIFYGAWQQAEQHPVYQAVKWFWKQTFG